MNFKIIINLTILLGFGSTLYADERRHPLPSKLGKVVASVNLDRLYLHFPAIKRIGVFNTTKFRMVGFLALDCVNARFTVGQKEIVTYSPKSREFKFWDVDSLVVKKKLKYKLKVPIDCIVMGHQNHSKILVIRANSANTGSRLSFLDTNTGVFRSIDYKDIKPLSKFQEDKITAVANSEGSAFVVNRGIGSRLISISGESVKAINVLKLEAVSFCENDKYLISKNGTFKLDQGELKQIKQFSGYSKYRHVVGGVVSKGSLYCEINSEKGRLKLCQVSDDKVDSTYSLKTGITFGLKDKFYIYPQREKLIIVESDNRRGKGNELVEIGLKKLSTAESYPIIKKKRLVKKNVKTEEGATLKIVSGFDGVIFDKTTNDLVWNVPHKVKKGKIIDVVLTETSRQGKSKFHTFKLVAP